MQVCVAKLALGHQPQGVLLLRTASVDVGAVQVAGDLVDLVPGPEVAVLPRSW